MIETVPFIFGEKKKIGIKIESTCCMPFEATNCTWELRNGDTVEVTGDCDKVQTKITETLLFALIQPQIKGTLYTLRFYYSIYPEKLIYDVYIRT